MHLRLARISLAALALLTCAACNRSTPPEAARQAPAVQVEPAPADTDSTTSTAQASTASFPSAGRYAQAELTYGVIGAPNGTYGYDIYGDGHLLIHQSSLPGRPGNEGCRTKADADKLAAFVMDKIRKGEMPPTVTAEELKALDIQ